MSEVDYRECRHVTHLKAKYNRPDLHVVKEVVHYEDGSVEPNIRIIKDFKRDFYTAKPNARGYKQKKEREHISKLRKHVTTESDMAKNAAKVLGVRGKTYLRKLEESPYLYGTSVPSTTFIKKMYDDRVSIDQQTDYTVMTLDIETNVFIGDTIKDHPVIIESVAMGDYVYVAINKEWLEDIPNVTSKLDVLLEKYLKKYTDKGLKAEFVIAKDEEETIRLPIMKAHAMKPDILAIWNQAFDICHIERRSHALGFDIAKLWTDPDIPAPAREYKFTEGRSFRITSSGKQATIPPASRWHFAKTVSSFVILDAMCVYRNLRSQAGEEPSYSLDAILGKELGERKLKFKEANHESGLGWHKFMQSKYPLEYVIYNVFDSYSMILLDNKTNDLSMVFPGMMEQCHYASAGFSSSKNDIYLYAFSKEQGYILGSPDFSDPEEEVMSPKGIIITLNAYMMALKGAKLLDTMKNVFTRIYKYTYDEDLVGAYPSIAAGCNVSKQTTKNEVISVEGISEDSFRRESLNLISGPVNMLTYCKTMFNLPYPEEVMRHFD